MAVSPGPQETSNGVQAGHGKRLDFHAIFDAVPGLYLILKPDFTIVDASDAYLDASYTMREKIIGKNIFEIFPDNPDDPHATGVKNLTNSLKTVLSTKAPHTMAVQKYDVRLPESRGGGFVERYWSPLNAPVLDKDGNVEYIIHSVVEVTQFVKLKQIEEKHSKIAEQLKVQNKLFQAEVQQSAKDIEEHKKNEQELRLIDRLRTEFIETASHQLRTPLTAIKWSSEALQHPRKGQTEEEQHKYIDHIHDSTQRLIEIIKDLLDASRVDFGTFSYNPVPVDLPLILEQNIRDTSKLAALKNIKISKEIEKNFPIVNADPAIARIIFHNLLTNAIKYSEAGKEIWVAVTKQSGNILITVKDEGEGIPSSQQDMVFTKFFRADNAKKMDTDSSGLGLYITKAMVNLAKGEIWFESVEGKGSTFYVKLPIENHKSN